MVQRVELAVQKPLTDSRTLLGLIVASIATIVREVLPLELYAESAHPIALAITALGITVAVYARVSDHKDG
tara:strand:- start:1315 stop:1527 length:213 start_codon:yes stop_codon:yes gene_type:complete